MPNKEDPAGHLKKYAWKPGESGNPNGRPLGAKNKVKYTREAFEDAAGLSPGEMLAQIARRQFAQNTNQGDAGCIKAITEANKYLEPTQDAKSAAEERIEDMSEEDLMTRLLELTQTDSKDTSKHQEKDMLIKTSLQKLPTLTEIFFGKGINPATDKPYIVKETPKKKEVSKKTLGE